MIGLVTGIEGQVLHLELDRCVGKRSHHLVEQSGMMAGAEIDLGESRPRGVSNDESGYNRVVTEHQLAVGASTNVEFDTVRQLGGGEEPGEAIVGESRRPAAMTEDTWLTRHRNNLAKSVNKRKCQQYISPRNPPKRHG